MTENNNLGELLPISENNGQKAVNARYLHSFLESKQEFANWIKGRISKYDFVEGKDFETLYFDYQGNLLNIRHDNFIKSENQQVSKIEYALSIGMAKELSMLENNERGKQARKYFIACEENKRELSRKELLLMALQAEEDKERLALENEQQKKTIELQSLEIRDSAPKLKVYHDYIASTGTFTATQIAKEYGWGAETLNKKLKELCVQYKQNGQWILTAKYANKGYTKSIPRTWTKSDGSTGIQMQTVWTAKGREFIHSLIP